MAGSCGQATGGGVQFGHSNAPKVDPSPHRSDRQQEHTEAILMPLYLSSSKTVPSPSSSRSKLELTSKQNQRLQLPVPFMLKSIVSSLLSPLLYLLSSSSSSSSSPSRTCVGCGGAWCWITVLVLMTSCGLTSVESQGVNTFDTGWDTNVTNVSSYGYHRYNSDHHHYQYHHENHQFSF
ncbi:hypothetical protein ElyMa_004597800 [Elysia marginata]|uniref:Uncharacterized protein n=1 Tax=Elysia marginata TaxID=1093978 RepID=A0AAV4HXZ3_9GAST|nr:hypothetical protein ElyMa_004597800 [Elysia marginata]